MKPGKSNAEIIDVEAEPVRAERAVAEVERADEVVVREEGDPLTVGEIVGGARGLIGGVAQEAKRLVDRGRYRKLRVTRKGKQVLPDIPLAAAVALEAASMYGAGIARVLAVNVGARFLFDVEVVNEADKYFERGKQALLDGDLDRALEALEKAVHIDDTHAGAFLQLGVLFRLQRAPEKARRMLERARALDDTGEIGRRAEEILRALDGEA